MFDFGKLSRKAQRAAFAHMSTSGSAKKVAQAAAKKVTPHPNLTKRYSHTETSKAGKVRSLGTISLAEAAEQMFGTKGAQERIAKYNARHAKKGSAARKVAAAKKSM